MEHPVESLETVVSDHETRIAELEEALADLLEASKLALSTLKFADTVGWDTMDGARKGDKAQKELSASITRAQVTLGVHISRTFKI